MTSAVTTPEVARDTDRRKLFERLLRDTSKQAFHLALRLTGSPADAEDLVQESFVRAYRFFHRFNETLPFTSWLYRIMTNAHIDAVRRKGRLRTASLDEPHPETGATWDLPDDSESAEDRLMCHEFDADVQQGLMDMTPDFRVAVLLADMEGLSYEEIAEVMNTSIGTVRSRIHRGRKQLRKILLTGDRDKYSHLL